MQFNLDTGNFVTIALAIVAGICAVFWDSFKHFFWKEKKLPPSSGISNSGGNFAPTSSIVATDDAKVEGDIIGRDKNVFEAENVIFQVIKPNAPILKVSDQKKDEVGRKKVERIMRLSSTPANKKELHEIFAQTNDEALKIQIALLLGPWFDPLEDCIAELVEVMNEAIGYARNANAKPQLAALLSYKGAFYSTLFTHEFMEFNIRLAQPLFQHAGLDAFYKRELDFKERYLDECFSEAKEIANNSGEVEAIAAVYMEIGQTAAHRATAYVSGDIPKSLETKKIVRESFQKAEDAYKYAPDLPNNGELEVANVRHNLANCLRMFGPKEIEEAAKIEEGVVETARKYGDSVLATKANYLLQRLHGKEIPNYVDGEKGEPFF